MSNADLIAMLTEMQEYVRIKEEAEAAAETLKDQIKAFMGDTEALDAGPYKVTWKTVTKRQIDSKALTKDHPEIAAEYTKTTSYRPFIVK